MGYIEFLSTNSSFILTGILVTLKIYSISMALGTIGAFITAFLCTAKNPVICSIAIAYVEVIRGTPLLIQLFWLFYVLPLFGIYLQDNFTGILALVASLSAWGSVVIRGAINSIPHGQWEACVALNLHPVRRMQRIILPQAILILFPMWGNLLVEYLKHSALISLIGITDVMYQLKTIQYNTFRSTESFGTALLIYYSISRFFLIPIFRFLEKKWARHLGIA
ncbi:MAG: amino acid ABC transporter permease [Mesorhizobium sp.]|nr:MAG: amino acid ABC transporter permease [Mesorhizobium sp.]